MSTGHIHIPHIPFYDLFKVCIYFFDNWHTTIQTFGSVRFYFFNTFIMQEHIQLIKSHSKGIYTTLVTLKKKKINVKKIMLFLSFVFIKESWKNLISTKLLFSKCFNIAN